MKSKLYFPMFVDMSDQKIIVIGAGNIAYRRTKALIDFAKDITVVAPQIKEEMEELPVKIQRRAFQKSDLDGVNLAVIATDDKDLNEEIAKLCAERNILRSVASDKALCDFYFPGIIKQEEIVIGVNASGVNHRKAKRMREKIEGFLGDMMEKQVIIGSRESKLAVIQSEMVMNYIKENHPEISVELCTMKTTGDKILDRTLDKIGGKGLFVKELDKALVEGKSDLSVHSLKDMPMEENPELPIIGFSKREDPRDVLVLPEGCTEIDFSKPIGCSSLRRTIQLKKLFRKATFASVRGNVITRLNKLDNGEYGALVLAAAGLKRLGLENRISRYFTEEEILPAAGQGILCLQGRKGEDYSYLEGFLDEDATSSALAERAFVRTLDGGCSSPIAAHAIVNGEEITVTGLYYDEEKKRYRKDTIVGNRADAEKLGCKLAVRLLNSEDKMEKGKVWLVGAGPGDIGLFTIKGLRALAQADVVVYDALVGQGILAMIPKDVECINVGKRSGNHTLPQEEINQVLLEEAQKGKNVVRLKGGDPFLFGRGGEELELLVENEIAYEVIPGVTSSIAVPAYNGIPVTHRDFCSSLHIITGHKKAGIPLQIDFEALVRTKGTLVFLMGVSALSDICSGLMEAGMEADMPAAILQQGTTARQKRIVATVSTLYDEVQKQGIETPAIIVVGKVCSLADEFAWYEKLPLFGYRVVVTRPKDLISRMSEKLRRLGAEVLEIPAIETVALKENHSLTQSLEKIGEYAWIAFTSPTGVRVFFEQMKENKIDIRKLGNVKIAAIGEGTRKALEEYSLQVDLIPEVYDGETLARELAQQCGRGEKVLLPRASAGNQKLVSILEEAGVIVEDIPTYDTRYVRQDLINETQQFTEGKIDCVVFTSASTVKGFVESTPDLDYTKVTAACIGKQTKAVADSYGMKTYMAKKASIDSVVELVINLKEKSEV